MSKSVIYNSKSVNDTTEKYQDGGFKLLAYSQQKNKHYLQHPTNNFESV